MQTGEGMICNPPPSNIGNVYPLQLSLRLCIVWAFIQFSANCSRPIRPICFCVGLTIKHWYIYYVGLFNVFAICIMILKLIVVILWFILIYFRPTDLHCDCEFAIMSIILKIKIHKLKWKTSLLILAEIDQISFDVFIFFPNEIQLLPGNFYK